MAQISDRVALLGLGILSVRCTRIRRFWNPPLDLVS